MYHFTADHSPEPVRLSFRAIIPGHIRQYLKDFQLDAIRFMHKFLVKDEFCVYNDESGLGKQASVAVLLDAVCGSRKCLIVVQNDDRYVNGWEFHFNVLTHVTATVIKDGKDSTDSSHNIYIAKWSTLRTIDDLSTFKFDYIIIDNRGQMLNNSFCTAMLLKYYERKINILISSVDITSDIKLLYNVLRLGGRLDPQYLSFKIFEEKYKLPDAKELAYKRVDLEEYFCKRERLADYCKTFRLRRYCHQFETVLPLVKEDRYKINLDLWREKQNATTSESNSIEYVNYQNREDERIKDTQELFEEYCRQRRKQHLQFQREEEQRLLERERERLNRIEMEKEIIYTIDDEVALTKERNQTIEKPLVGKDNSDEQVLMSPLLVESDSDTEDLPQIYTEPTDMEIVDLSSEENFAHSEHNEFNEHNINSEFIDHIENNFEIKNVENSETSNDRKKAFKKKARRTEVDKLEENIVNALKIEITQKRLRRHSKVSKSKEMTKSVKTQCRLKGNNAFNVNSTGTSTRGRKVTSNRVKSEEISQPFQKNTTNIKTSLSINKGSVEEKKKILKENRKENKNDSELVVNEDCINPNDAVNMKSKPSTSSKKFKGRKTNSTSAKENLELKPSSDNETNNTIPLTSRKTRSMNKSATTNKTLTNTIKNETHIKQEHLGEIVAVRRGRPRLKRGIEITPVGVHHKHTRSMQRLTRSAGAGSKYLTKNLSLQIDRITKTKKKLLDKSTAVTLTVTNKAKNKIEDKFKNEKNTQISVISHRSSQDYESIQCAQRLSDAGVFDNVIEKTAEFIIPPTPNTAKNSLIPSSLTSSTGCFTESDVIFIPPSTAVNVNTKKRDQVILLSSSDNENSTSQSSAMDFSTTSRRTRALKPKRVQQQQSALESSDVSQISELHVQQNIRLSAKSPDLFSNCSDLLQLPCSQPNLNSEEPNTPFESFKIFGSEVKQLQQHYAFSKNNLNRQNINAKKCKQDQRSCLNILEKMFEPSNKKEKPTTNQTSSSISKDTRKTYRSGAVIGNKFKTQAPILPSHPIEALTEARLQHEHEKHKHSTAFPACDDIFEITNNGTFGNVMRLHANGEILPVQQTQKTNPKQHNKITNYLIGSLPHISCPGSQEETTPNSVNSGINNHTEAGTPSKRQQLPSAQNINVKKSPKGKCSSTQTTKLTKWFTKPSEHQRVSGKSKFLNSKKTPTIYVELSEEINLDPTSSFANTSLPVRLCITALRWYSSSRLHALFKNGGH